MTDTITPNMFLNDQATTVVRAMQEQTALVHGAWHSHQPEWAMDQALSLSRHLADLMTWGGDIKVYRDGPLSLYVQTNSIVFGVIFHRKHRVPQPIEGDITIAAEASMMGRYCMFGFDGGTYCCQPFTDEGPGCKGHMPFVAAMPIPGTWSFHS